MTSYDRFSCMFMSLISPVFPVSPWALWTESQYLIYSLLMSPGLRRVSGNKRKLNRYLFNEWMNGWTNERSKVGFLPQWDRILRPCSGHQDRLNSPKVRRSEEHSCPNQVQKVGGKRAVPRPIYLWYKYGRITEYPSTGLPLRSLLI